MSLSLITPWLESTSYLPVVRTIRVAGTQFTWLLAVSREKVPSALKIISSETVPRQPIVVSPRHVPTTVGLVSFPPSPPPPPHATDTSATTQTPTSASPHRRAGHLRPEAAVILRLLQSRGTLKTRFRGQYGRSPGTCQRSGRAHVFASNCTAGLSAKCYLGVVGQAESWRRGHV